MKRRRTSCAMSSRRKSRTRGRNGSGTSDEAPATSAMASTTPGGGIALTGETHDDTFIAPGLVGAVGSSRGGSDERLVPHLRAAEPGDGDAMCRVRHHVRDRVRYGESRRNPRGLAG